MSEYTWGNELVSRTDWDPNRSSRVWKNTNYYHQDVLGSTMALSDRNGNVVERYLYDVFGNAYEGTFQRANELGYTGQRYDAATGWYNYGYRDYAPAVGRFTTVDPIRDGNNWYAYVGNDPVNFTDPTGLSASDLPSLTEINRVQTGVPTTQVPEEVPLPVPQVPTNPNDYHCDINSWNQLLEQGFDPRPADGSIPDFNDITVAEIYDLYSTTATDHPTSGTSGYGFYADTPGGDPNHMFVYEYSGGDTYTVWDSPGITEQTQKEWSIGGSADTHSTFVPQPLLD